ncbi:unnamed protein product [Closterium sp. Yama58-4]|nr:unnamed protein product [Closterium sp. Yama58-4]
MFTPRESLATTPRESHAMTPRDARDGGQTEGREDGGTEEDTDDKKEETDTDDDDGEDGEDGEDGDSEDGADDAIRDDSDVNLAAMRSLKASRSRRGMVSFADRGSGSEGGGGDGEGDDGYNEEVEQREKLDQEVIQAMYERVKHMGELTDNFKNLFFFLCYTCLYLAVLYLQADASICYQVTTAHNVLLPPDYTAAASMTMNGPDDFYSWINDSIIQVVWKDPPCGNGICERPLEFEAFGRFGCSADCGDLTEVTSVTVHLTTDFHSALDAAASSWNLCRDAPTPLCWYPEDQQFTELASDTQVTLSLPDGSWSLVLNAPGGGVAGTSPRPSLSQVLPPFSPPPFLPACRPARALRAVWPATVGLEGTPLQPPPRTLSPSSSPLLAPSSPTCPLLSYLPAGMLALCRLSGQLLWRVLLCNPFLALCLQIPSLPLLARSSPTYSQACSRFAGCLASYCGAGGYSPAALSSLFVTCASACNDNSSLPFLPFTDFSCAEIINATADGLAGFQCSLLLRDKGTCCSHHHRHSPVSPLTAFQMLNVHTFPFSLPFSTHGAVHTHCSNQTARLSRDQAARFVLLLTAALKSVVLLPDDDVADAARLLRALDPVVVDPSLPSCGTTDAARLLHALDPVVVDPSLPSCGTTGECGTSIGQPSTAVRTPFRAIPCHVWHLMSLPRLVCTIPCPTTRHGSHGDVGDEQAAQHGGAYSVPCHTMPCVASLSLVSCVPSLAPPPGTGPTVMWGASRQPSTVVPVGERVTWVWADGQPHAINVAGFGDAATTPFYGMGSGRLVVSADVACSAENVGTTATLINDSHASTADPAPCVLRPTSSMAASSPPTPFSYTTVFPVPGTFVYECSRVGEPMRGSVTVLPPSSSSSPSPPPSSSSRSRAAIGQSSKPIECAPGCLLSSLADGKCNPPCNVDECAFDGGDCACALPATSIPEPASVASGSVPGSGLAIGDGLSFPFTLDMFSNATSAAGNAASAGNATSAVASAAVAAGNASSANGTEEVALSRFVAEQNRVLIGLKIEQTRWDAVTCQPYRFSSLFQNCMNGISTAPFGVNPHFLPSSSLYFPDAYVALNDSLTSADVDTMQPIATRPDGVPYGFQVAKANEKVFPVIFDINLDNEAATRRLQYLADSFFIDNATQSVSVAMLTYNGDSSLFVYTTVRLNFEIGGKIAVTYSVDPVDVELYSSSADWVRLTVTVLYVCAVVWNLIEELVEAFQCWLETGRITSYFRTLWNWLDVLSLTIQFIGIIMCWPVPSRWFKKPHLIPLLSTPTSSPPPPLHPHLISSPSSPPPPHLLPLLSTPTSSPPPLLHPHLISSPSSPPPPHLLPLLSTPTSSPPPPLHPHLISSLLPPRRFIISVQMAGGFQVQPRYDIYVSGDSPFVWRLLYPPVGYELAQGVCDSVLNLVQWPLLLSPCISLSASPSPTHLPPSSPQQLQYPPMGYEQAQAVYDSIRNLVQWRSILVSLQGINVFLFLLRLLKLMDFQPRIAILTRTMAAAFPALVHFFLLWAIMFIGFSFYAYVVFGRTLEQFSTVAMSMVSCFLILINDNSTGYYFIQLEGWNLTAAIIFWVAYISVMVFVMLNVLIAIVVDAFLEVRKSTEESPAFPVDMWYVLRNVILRLSTDYWKPGRLQRHLLMLGADDGYVALEDSVMAKSAAALKEGFNRVSRWCRGLGRSKPRPRRVLRVGKRCLNADALLGVLERCAAHRHPGSDSVRRGFSFRRQADADPTIEVRPIANVILAQFGEVLDGMAAPVAPLREQEQQQQQEEEEHKRLKDTLTRVSRDAAMTAEGLEVLRGEVQLQRRAVRRLQKQVVQQDMRAIEHASALHQQLLLQQELILRLLNSQSDSDAA